MKFSRKIVIVIVIFMLLLITHLGACSKIHYDAEGICDNYIGAVVELQVRDDGDSVVGNATGTIINASGDILTNRHVVRSYSFALEGYVYYENFYIRKYNETDYTKIALKRISQNSDLALLKTENKVEKYLNLGSADTLSYGETIHTIGNGNGYGLAYAQGHIAAPMRIVKYEDEMIDAIQLGLNINEGNSGGPLINSKGELVGITTFRLRDKQNNVIQGTSFALPIKTINEFLQESN
jgi:S1-C subfamily serine protease